VLTSAAVSVCAIGATFKPLGDENRAVENAVSSTTVEPSASASAAPVPSPAESAEPGPDPAPERVGCSVDDPGAGPYRTVELGIANARLHVPANVPDRFPLLLHFHGGEPVRRLLVSSELGLVFATVDAGVGSERYAATVTPKVPEQLLHAIEEKTGRTIGKLILSSWSAGYGALRSWLGIAPDAAQALVFLDSIHTSYGPDGEVDRAGLTPFFAVAKRAATGSPLVLVTHSAIVPPGYASTTEVADALVAHVGGKRRYAGLEAQFGVLAKTRSDERSFHVRGTTGGDEAAHCAHLRMLPELLKRDVLPYLAR
jgi:hypothetical protein